MRHALITLIASFIGVLAALFAYNSYRDAALARTKAVEEIEQQARLKQGQQLIERTLADERAALAIRNDVVAIAAARTAIAETYMSNGRMPASNAEAGLPAADTYKGQSLVSMKVAADGGIILTFDAASGVEGGVIEWLPDLTGIESMGLQWHCQTHDYPLIARALPNCRYEPTASVSIGSDK